MAEIKQVFDHLLNLFVIFWNNLSNWGTFGAWLLFMTVIRKIANTFNKLKSNGG